jgi:hypothetical protein
VFSSRFSFLILTRPLSHDTHVAVRLLTAAPFVVMEQAAFLIGESGGICVRARAGRGRGVITSVAVSMVWIRGTCTGILTSVLAFGIAGRRDIEEMSHAFQLDLVLLWLELLVFSDC